MSAREMRYTRHAVSRAGFGLCCGVVAFEVAAAVAAGAGGLSTIRPGFLLLATLGVTLIGAFFAWAKGTPTCRRAWALFAMGVSAGSAVAELLDLHVLALHRGPNVAASIVLHGLAVLPGLLAGRLLLQIGARDVDRTAAETPGPVPPGAAVAAVPGARAATFASRR